MSFLSNLVFRPIEQIPSWQLVDDDEANEDGIDLKSPDTKGQNFLSSRVNSAQI